jgi:hypothetical protein
MNLLKYIFLSLLAFSSCSLNQKRMNSSFSQKDVLDYLEETGQETYHFFIDFEHPYFHTAGSRLTLYADDKRWAIVFEKSGYDNRGYTGAIALTYFGNCLINLKSKGDPEGFTSNMDDVILIDNKELQRIENNTDELVSKSITQIKVRDTLLNFEQDKSVYEKRGITDTVYENAQNLIDFPSLIRYLDEEHPTIFRATEKELRLHLPDDLPRLMVIDQWHHEAYEKYRHMTSPTKYNYEIMGTKPSAYETYKMIADILVSRDTSKWKPTLKANNNWRNWPNAGNL